MLKIEQHFCDYPLINRSGISSGQESTSSIVNSEVKSRIHRAAYIPRL